MTQLQHLFLAPKCATMYYILENDCWRFDSKRNLVEDQIFLRLCFGPVIVKKEWNCQTGQPWNPTMHCMSYKSHRWLCIMDLVPQIIITVSQNIKYCKCLAPSNTSQHPSCMTTSPNFSHVLGEFIKPHLKCQWNPFSLALNSVFKSHKRKFDSKDNLFYTHTHISNEFRV